MNINKITSIMPMRRDFHVVPDGFLWKVTEERRTFAIGHHLTKLEAMAEGMKQAREGHVSLVIHGRDGRIQRVYSYDNWTGPFD